MKARHSLSGSSTSRALTPSSSVHSVETTGVVSDTSARTRVRRDVTLARAPHARIPTLTSTGEPPRNVHLLGAGGAGVSGVGLLFASRGVHVGGSDRAESAFVDLLREAGVDVHVGQQQDLPGDVDLVVHSAAIDEADAQLVEAKQRGVETLKYAECLARLAPARRTIGVAGTHGKTTTSWFAYHALLGMATSGNLSRTQGLPGALIGGSCRSTGANAVPAEENGWFVAEACEYDRTFLQLAPEGAIVTNVEADHLDYYGSYEELERAFACFADRVHPEGLLVVGRDVPELVEATCAAPVWRLGRELEVELTGEALGRFRFRLRGPGWRTRELEVPIPGAHNVENAALAVGLAIGLAGRGESVDEARMQGALDGLATFRGAERRFESWGSQGGVDVVHDYAHHPTEIRCTLEAARRALPGRPLHVLFQPHQHSRTARFMADFVDSLRSADRVVVSDVYGARKHIDAEAGAGADELATRLRRAGVDATYGAELWQSTRELIAGLPAKSAALILGAGDVDRIQHDLLDQLALRGPASSGLIV